MTAPQIIMAGYLTLSMIYFAVNHGEPRTGTWHIGVGWITCAVIFGVLWWGGFWR